MRTELDQKLCNDYPKIFRDRHAPMTETCMCWGFECGDGWYNIINQLCANIQNHIEWTENQHNRDVKFNEMITAALAGDLTLISEYYSGFPDSDLRIKEAMERGLITPSEKCSQVVAQQVKEKFGTLRFYTSGGDDVVDGMIRMAESMSGVTCETCGAPGERHGGGWVRTLCDIHEAEYQKSRNQGGV